MNTQTQAAEAVGSSAELGVITHDEVMSLAASFARSANWLIHGTLDGPARTHPLVGLADYQRAATILRAAAHLWAHSESTE